MNNFTPRAQQVLALARKEADRFNHSYVGTEHLLLGLIKLGQGVAVNVLQKMGLDLDTVRQEVEKEVRGGGEAKSGGNIPYTPRVKKVLALVPKEKQSLLLEKDGKKIRIGFQDSCHLRNGLGIFKEPRAILKSLGEYVEIPNASGCCGAAGSYSLLQRKNSQKVIAKKIENER